ncbi:MAG: DNA mismatch repair protein MutS [Clostridia bacterium]|nr:DNA mismatch repair protein MutS [Clostridia bacterium]
MALSPMMRQYLITKEQYKDCILLYRLGDFYEMFYEDAIKASEALDLVLTGKNCGEAERAPMCGIPYHAADNYIAKLVSQGFKVAICEQLTDPSASKGLVERGVVRVITPGTVIESEMLDDDKNNFIASVYVTNNDCAITWADISTGDIFATKFEGEKSLSNLFEHLLSVNVKEIICNKQAEKLNESAYIRQNVLPRLVRYESCDLKFSDSQKLCSQRFSKEFVKNSDFASKSLICSLANLLTYIDETQKISLIHLKEVVYVDTAKYMILDANAKSHLEIFVSSHDKKKRGSLFWLLNKTKTAMGSRLLNQWMEQPLQDVCEIEYRHKAVEEFINNFILRENARESLQQVKDIERITTKISYASITPKDCLALQQSLSKLPAICDVLSKSKNEYILSLCQQIPDLSVAENLLFNAIDENAPALTRDGGFIKQGFNEQLDECRDLSQNGVRLISELEAKQREITGIKTLKIGFNRVFGYFYEVTNSYKDQVPIDFVRKQTISNSERYINDELKVLENDILSAHDRGLKIEKDLYADIINTLKEYIRPLQQVAHILAQIDCLTSFAVCSIENDYCKPTMVKNDRLYIEEGRHPVVENFTKDEKFVPNDTLLDNGENRTMIITGPNMAGKSTFMRQVALIVFMAHIGCFVPAKQAQIPIVDKIFTRVGANDDLTFKQSTFMVEMSEVATILNNATQNSLIVLDEVGRGTATFDGLSIAWAVMEYISTNIKAKTLFATHYHELTELEGKIEGVKNYKICVKEFNNSIIFLRKIARGGANKSFGIEVAALAGVKEEVIANARNILSKLESADITFDINKLENPVQNDDKAAKKIKRILKELDLNKCTPLEAFSILADLVEQAKD